MSDAQAATRPEDQVGFARMLAYGVGGFVNNTLAAAIGGMLIVLNLGLGMDPAWVGLLGALPRLFDALTDPIMGYVSDHTRSRWGRRRPYIFGGALAAGLVYIGLWLFPPGLAMEAVFGWLLGGSLLFYAAYTCYATPWVALGYELTPDYHERTRLMGVQNFVGQLAYVVSPWFLWFMTQERWFDTPVTGARALAGLVGLCVMALGVLPALLLRERFVATPAAPGPAPGLAASCSTGRASTWRWAGPRPRRRCGRCGSATPSCPRWPRHSRCSRSGATPSPRPGRAAPARPSRPGAGPGPERAQRRFLPPSAGDAGGATSAVISGKPPSTDTSQMPPPATA